MNSSKRALTLYLILSLALVATSLSLASPQTLVQGFLTITSTFITTTSAGTAAITSTTTTSISTSTTATSTSTSSTSLTTSFSYTSTRTLTFTNSSTSTSYTSTGSTITTTSTTSTQPLATSTQVVGPTTTVLPSIGCPVAFATSGTPLEPYANFLRGFRNNQIQNTTAGRMFMQTFNGWYYGWAPSFTYAASANPWFLDALRVGVYPLIGILYASYFSYAAVSPFSAEAGALAAGVVAASLIGLIYVAPIAYVCTRLIRRRAGLFRAKKMHMFPALGWMSVSALMVGAAYLSASAWLMGVATASLTLSFLSTVSIFGALALNSIQLPLANLYAMAFAPKRMARSLR